MVNLRFEHFRMLTLPSFWWSIFTLSIKEHWIYLVVFCFIFNSSSLFRAEFLEFLISSVVVSAIIGALLIIYTLFKYTVKAYKCSNFRNKTLTESSIYVGKELLGIKFDEPQHTSYSSLRDDLPDTTSKIGFAFIIGIGLVTILGLLYVTYLVANR